MIFSECGGKAREQKLKEVTCPHCGAVNEMLTGEPSIECEACGKIIVNDAFSCVRWCDHAKECVGPEVYEKLMNRFDAQNFELEDEPRNYYGL